MLKRYAVAAAITLPCLTGCTEQQVQTTEQTLAGLCQAYSAAAPTLHPAPDSAEANLMTYASAACTVDGAVQPAVQADAGTAAWLLAILQGLRIAAPVAAALL